MPTINSEFSKNLGTLQSVLLFSCWQFCLKAKLAHPKISLESIVEKRPTHGVESKVGDESDEYEDANVMKKGV